MRTTSYFVTFLCVLLTFIFNVLSIRRPDWLVVKSPEILRTTVTSYYGLLERCDWTVTRIPSRSGSGQFEYTDYSCRKFPTAEEDSCNERNHDFCVAWTTAAYVSEVAIGFGAVTLLAIMIGVTTYSWRRRMWKVVATLVLLHALLQVVTFAVITDLYRAAKYPTFDQARPGLAYVLSTVSWVIGIILAASVAITGLAADRGHHWAAGNHAYQPID